MAMMDLLKTVIWIQLFYTLSITFLVYAMPADMVNQVVIAQDSVSGLQTIQSTSDLVSSSVSSTKNLPLVELGSLIFYSGNILLDLVLNFITAIPQMLTFLLDLVSKLFSFDTFYMTQLKTAFGAIVTIFYLIGLFQTLTSMRSRGGII